MAEALAFASFSASSLGALRTLRSLNDAPGIHKEIRRIIAEFEILGAIVQESSSTLARLTESPPYSATMAMKQCSDTGTALVSMLDEFNTSSRLRQALYALEWVERKARIKDLLEAFRVSTSLLREVTAE